MRVMYSVWLMCLLVTVLCGCSSPESLTLGDDGTRVVLAPGDIVEVSLEGNATTGFAWELVELDPMVIAVQGDPGYEAEDSELVGAGGTWTWVLVAQQSGESVVRFAYRRTWEDEPPEASFSFTAEVSD